MWLFLGLSTHTQPPIKKVDDETFPIPHYAKKFKKHTENKKYRSDKEAEPNLDSVQSLNLFFIETSLFLEFYMSLVSLWEKLSHRMEDA